MKCRKELSLNTFAKLDRSKSLSHYQNEALEKALWSAIRMMQERVEFLKAVSARQRGKQKYRSEEKFLAAADELKTQADEIRRFLI